MEEEEAKVEKEFPNELFDVCGAEENVEEVRLIDIPYGKGKTREEEEHILNCVKVNELKKQELKFTQASREERKL
jgi:hypothetical protein